MTPAAQTPKGRDLTSHLHLATSHHGMSGRPHLLLGTACQDSELSDASHTPHLADSESDAAATLHGPWNQESQLLAGKGAARDPGADTALEPSSLAPAAAPPAQALGSASGVSQPGPPRSSGPNLMQAHISTCQPGGFLPLWTGGLASRPPGGHTSAQTRAGVEVTTGCPLFWDSRSPQPQPGTEGLSETPRSIWKECFSQKLCE